MKTNEVSAANEIFEEIQAVIDRVKDDWWKYEYICGLKEAENAVQRVIHKYS